MRPSILPTTVEGKINHLMRWALESSSTILPVSLTVSASKDTVYSLLDLRSARLQERGALINARTRALCALLGDAPRNVRFWCWLLWRALALEDSRPGIYATLDAMLGRLLVDLDEWGQDLSTSKPLRSPGALFVKRLKESGWWERLNAV